MPELKVPMERSGRCSCLGWLPVLLFLLVSVSSVVIPAQTGGSDVQGGSGLPASQGGSGSSPQQQAAPPPAPKPGAEMSAYSINVDVPLVTLDALVLSKNGEFVPGLRKEQFRVWEDNVEQPIESFGVTRAGYTAVLLVEFASTPAFQVSRRQFLYDALRASYAFTEQMQKDDFVSVISYDATPSVLVDFTGDKQAVYAALDTLRTPGMSESNLFDALYDTLDRLERVEGRKEIVLIGSGVDSFSKITYDKVLQKIRDTPNVTIYTISTGFLWRQSMEARPGMGASMGNMDFQRADGQMSTFARMTGGRWFSPRFEAELPEEFRTIASAVRNPYTLSYRPSNRKQDGSYRRLKVQLVQPGTDKPLVVKNEKGKEVKYQVITRDGYTARHAVE